MAIPARTSRPGTFFVTSGTYNRRRLFQVDRNAELLVETLQHYRAEGHYKLHAFVVMPDHIHLLLTPQETLERAIGLIKLREASPTASPPSFPSGSEASPTTASATPQTAASAIATFIKTLSRRGSVRSPKRISFLLLIRRSNSMRTLQLRNQNRTSGAKAPRILKQLWHG